MPARKIKISLIRNEIHISAYGDASSLVLSPQKFSYCLSVSDKGAILARANLMTTAIVLLGEINSNITFDYGMLSPKCRRSEMADMRNMAIKLPASGSSGGALVPHQCTP